MSSHCLNNKGVMIKAKKVIKTNPMYNNSGLQKKTQKTYKDPMNGRASL